MQPVIYCRSCQVSLSLAGNSASIMATLHRVAIADGWFPGRDGWLCDVCVPGVVDLLGDLADDRP